MILVVLVLLEFLVILVLLQVLVGPFVSAHALPVLVYYFKTAVGDVHDVTLAVTMVSLA